jgi:hypothetical protein
MPRDGSVFGPSIESGGPAHGEETLGSQAQAIGQAQ